MIRGRLGLWRSAADRAAAADRAPMWVPGPLFVPEEILRRSEKAKARVRESLIEAAVDEVLASDSWTFYRRSPASGGPAVIDREVIQPT